MGMLLLVLVIQLHALIYFVFHLVWNFRATGWSGILMLKILKSTIHNKQLNVDDIYIFIDLFTICSHIQK